MKSVVDSDILIDMLRQQEKAKIFIEKIIKDDNAACISTLTEAEVLSGKECMDNIKREKTEGLLSSFRVIDVTQFIARKAAEFRREHDVPLHDAIIAATAVELKVPLHSRNVNDFRKIQDLKLVVPY